MIQAKLFYLLACTFYWLWSAAIVAVSLIPSAGIGTAEFGNIEFRIDYPLHAIAFFPLPLSAWITCNYRSSSPSVCFAGMIAISIILAIGTEFMQIMVPGRSFNVMDIISNILGIILGLSLALAYAGKRTWKYRPERTTERER